MYLFGGKSFGLLVALIGVVCCSDVWQQFRGQRFPRRNVKPKDESVYSSQFRALEVQSVSRLRSVTVECGEENLLVEVHLDLFGTRHLVQAADLTLGTAHCRPTGIYQRNSTAVFNYGLHECGTKLQMVGDYLIYSTHLNYTLQARGAITLRTNGAVVPILCRYFSKGNVSSDPIQPTWIPFSSTKSGEGRLSFSLRLMNDDWLTERTSATYYLGELLHIEASVSMTDHMPLKLYIDRCVATLSPDTDSTPSYNIIDYNGCLLDSAVEDSYSAFALPGAEREPDKLRFHLDAFRFFGDEERSLIFITCLLTVAAVERSDSMNKACTFQKEQKIWTPLEESTADVCACCVGDCAATRGTLATSGRRDIVAEAENYVGVKREGEASLGPLLILDPDVSGLATEALNETEGRELRKSTGGLESEVMFAVALTVTTASLVSAVLIILFLYRKHKQTLSTST